MRRLGERRRRRPEGESTIALINIVFLLLIFFLVAGTLSAPRDASVDLATAEAFDPAALDPHAIYVDAEGTLRVGGSATDAAGAIAAASATGEGTGEAAGSAGGSGAGSGAGTGAGAGPGAGAGGDALVVVPDRALEAGVLLARLAELRQASDRPIRILTRRPAGGSGGGT